MRPLDHIVIRSVYEFTNLINHGIHNIQRTNATIPIALPDTEAIYFLRRQFRGRIYRTINIGPCLHIAFSIVSPNTFQYCSYNLSLKNWQGHQILLHGWWRLSFRILEMELQLLVCARSTRTLFLLRLSMIVVLQMSLMHHLFYKRCFV